jgi:glycosyltransferase involved in cell wall biosynthesis
LKLVCVLWNGGYGGAEVVTGGLVSAMRRLGVDARVVFVSPPVQPLSAQLEAAGVPHASLGLRRGRSVLRHPFHLAGLVKEADPECALLVSSGYLAGALRLGGYRRLIVAVEHGTLLQLGRLPTMQRFLRRLDRASGLWACDGEVGVSKFVFNQLASRRHARPLACIQNGIDLDRFRSVRSAGELREERSQFVVGCGARLIPEKGVDRLIRAFAAAALPNAVLRIAGDGHYRSALEDLARALGVADRTEFHGNIDDMPVFWQRCDVAAVPSLLIESFSIAAVEAMACGCPVIASRAGALPETVVDGETGTLVDAGDVRGLEEALVTYARDPSKLHAHGENARLLCERRYDVVRTAASYRDFIRSLGSRTGPERL